MKNLENKNTEVKDQMNPYKRIQLSNKNASIDKKIQPFYKKSQETQNNKINLKEAIVGFHNIFMDAQKQKLEFDEYADKLSEKIEKITSDFY